MTIFWCADLLFSSGTTGVAKGVAITHQNMTSAIQSGVINPLYHRDYAAVMIGTIPLYHACTSRYLLFPVAAGLRQNRPIAVGLSWILHQVLYLGYKVVMLPRFDMEVFLSAIEEHKVTLAPVVPPIALGLLRHPIVAK